MFVVSCGKTEKHGGWLIAQITLGSLWWTQTIFLSNFHSRTYLSKSYFFAPCHQKHFCISQTACGKIRLITKSNVRRTLSTVPVLFYRETMTRRLSSSTRSHTEDSIFLRPDEDPVWLDEPTKAEKIRDRSPKKDLLSNCKVGPSGGQTPKKEEVFMHKVYALVVEIHCWAALFVVSQVTVSKCTVQGCKIQQKWVCLCIQSWKCVQ